MKKILWILIVTTLGVMWSAFAWSPTEFTNETTAWLQGNGLTKYETKEAYRPNDFFTREQAARFFANFGAHYVGGKTLLPESECQFSDINEADETLRESITASCQLGIFKGYQWRFDPKAKMTLAEAGAAMVRITHGMMDETNRTHWYDNYLAKAVELNIVPNVDRSNLGRSDYVTSAKDANSLLSRWAIWLMLYRAPRLYMNVEYKFSFYYPFDGIYTTTNSSYVKIENINKVSYSEQPAPYKIESNITVWKDCKNVIENSYWVTKYNITNDNLYIIPLSIGNYILFCRNIGGNAATVKVTTAGIANSMVGDTFKTH